RPIISHVHGNVGLDVVILNQLQQQSRAMRQLSRTIVRKGFNFTQAGKKNRIVDQVSCPAVIGMPINQCIGNDNVRAVFADGSYNGQLMGFVVTEKSITQAKVLAGSQPQYSGGPGGLRITRLGRAAGAQLPAGKVDNSYLPSHLHMFNNGASTA